MPNAKFQISSFGYELRNRQSNRADVMSVHSLRWRLLTGNLNFSSPIPILKSTSSASSYL